MKPSMKRWQPPAAPTMGLMALASLALCGQAQAYNCTGVETWTASKAYSGGAVVQNAGAAYSAKWWTQNQNPATTSGQWDVWKPLGACDGVAVNQPPVAAFTTTPSGLSVSFDGSGSTDKDGSIASYAWTFGDGSTATGAKASRTYAAAGTYSVVLTVTDDKGAKTSLTKSVTVSSTPPVNQPPVAAFTSTASGLAVAFDGSGSTDKDGSIASYAWTFGDGGTASGAKVSRTYAAAGTYSVVLTVTDDKGAKTSLSRSVSVTAGGDTGGGADAACRPDGLYVSPGTSPAYCKVYDTSGREKMGADHPRRIIGYFTSWRTGKDGSPAYLASQIPWNKVTHINYAFAHLENNQLSVGNAADANNPATGLTWPGVAGAEMDPSFSYKGHFNLLNKFKKQYPNVKTLVSVGGWAETGGHFDASGKRVASGGFYTMTTNADNSVNTAGINTFADSAVAFIRQYGFDGVDIDYEYATSMKGAGNPDDFAISDARRAGLMKSFSVLMKTLREKLDAAGTADKRHYMLTVAAPASGYLLRGMENYQVAQYLDYVNIMSYDLHGAWNQFVGPNAALFDDGNDSELKAWNYYTASQYGRIGYLNTDWAYHYFRGAMPAGRINIGVPYYTRGWKDVQGGTSGLWGTAALPDQTKCPAGTGGSTTNKCGVGAIGIDNLWHDLDVGGKEVPAGSNPLWHTMNLAAGKSGSYLAAYGLDPSKRPEDQLVGSYARNYSASLVAPWLWNAQKKVFISTEDDQSLGVKAQYVVDRGIGGVMFWELAGDYAYDSAKGEYFMGNTLTNLLYDKFKTATPYGATKANQAMPAQALDIGVDLAGFALGDSNYPINPKMTITNRSTVTLAGGTEFGFDVPTAIPDSITDQSGFGLKVSVSGTNAGGGNVGGLKNDFHRVSFKLPTWQSLAPGASVTITLNYYLPAPMPSNWTVNVGGTLYGIKQDHGVAATSTLKAQQGVSKTNASIKR